MTEPWHVSPHHGVSPDEQETSCAVEVTCGSREPIAAADREAVAELNTVTP